MDIIFWKGIFIGLLVALPTGPVGFLTIRRIYLFGMRSGMYSAIGAIMTDAFYGVVVGFGLKKVSHFLVSIAGYAEIAVGFILLWVAYQSFHKKIDFDHALEENHPIRDITSIALLNILNPALVFSFTTMFVLIGMQRSIGHPREIITFLIGIAVGTLLFWYVVGKGVMYLRRNNKEHLVHQINRVTGAILGAVGVILLLLALVRIIF